ncbi:UDP-GalNAc:beta-1,3-N-acetylgalactosaminyltransferase 1 [Pogona vitticeps]|uniref:Hexosyltransferase n=1 Tax=Pogona vitticeps TaxID=103695 RepID=A0A6J0TGL4_9SAUR|nr:UDP-GalNAc:beta-1,3-N-acetylgalactosaminyltransferase 1 [Pogona vitticeps]XP_020647445.1 UDP-GalNAc:beta-1,3-N-acetylgalactosaminyltransferase 1 [Pogona vitticeps]XP_020647446.1 UDP-GalNAc:beta-1,3-N-acetylgalactosaminyltransferase 1 [Pogona vitticeps]XP_020647447.1 UDP-GalNAc:beta-1,3-N-acetylgalactosaminyltransferase 1 [Pogona vitticeps]XP_020647448.1 UDP-GalNAc:beta-1,3-N-acetylgalactosaminyltransferase 1 [Pogona vitticeps]XP_020647449.1 UDP-GalNAc:beta-1,3-N-acetylgalactosaminyltransfer
MAMKYLKSFVYGLTVVSVILMAWYVAFPSHTVMEHIDWLYFYKHEPVYKQTFLFTLRERLKCKDNPFLVILVSSRPSNVKARQAIRITWGSQRSWWGKQVLTLFLLGKGTEKEDARALSVEDESILYGDIIQQDFLDTYRNLTLKTIMAFRWVTEFCSSAQYVMKTDDDVFINTGNLVKFLLNTNASENFMTGYPLIENYPYRGFYWKSYISYDEYPFKVYPPYWSGLGYVLDVRLARRVYKMMSHVKPFKFEDVYVGICLGILGVKLFVPDDVELFFLYRIRFDICKYKHLIAAHAISPQEIIIFWQTVTRESTSLPCH